MPLSRRTLPGSTRILAASAASHCKNWGAGQGADQEKDRGYRVLFGEGDVPWTKVFEAAESVGGVEYYLIEQEGSRFPELETAERCLASWKKLRS